MLQGLFLAVTVILAVLTLLPLWRSTSWWVRGLDFARLQLAIISLVLLILGSLVLDVTMVSTWGILIAITLCFCYQAWWIVPYTIIYPLEVKSPQTRDKQEKIRIVTANVLTSNRNAEGLLGLIYKNDPDLFVTLESDQWWQSKLGVLQSQYPFTVKCPLDNLYGMHVYSKLEMTNSQIKYLVEQDIPSIHTMVRLRSGQKIRMHFLHPAPPSPTQNGSSEERDAELIILAKSVAESNVPIIVTGDLNDVAWSETTRLFRKISGLLDPRIGRGMYNTFHADYWFLRWPLDHLFHSGHFTLSQMRKLEKFGSDHFALMTELVYEFAGEITYSDLEADADDKEQEKEKTDKQNACKKDVPEPEKQ